MSMFCYQCEQTARCTGCTTYGVCGKDPDTSALIDLLIHVTKGLGQYAHNARLCGATDDSVNLATAEALFSTVTNVNFDPLRLAGVIRQTVAARDKAKAIYEDVCANPVPLKGPAVFDVADDLNEMIEQGLGVGIEKRMTEQGEDVTGLQELLIYGLKGAAAYLDHAHILGRESEEAYAFFHKALNALALGESSIDTLFDLVMECGKSNLTAMEVLDGANTGTYGHPEPTPVRITAVKGKAILVSGHDLKDLEEILKQTEGTGINIYTHGEMLPCHGYPGLKKYSHLVGNYGGAWQDQREEFEKFPGSILMTTNCIQKPKDAYKARIFTTGLVAWPGVEHVTGYDFKPVIDAALEAPGFPETEPEKTILVGFGRNAVLGVADKVIEAVKAGNIRHFFLVGGCDGAKSGRNYFTDIAKAIPDDCVILTLACGKYRFNKLDFGDIGGIPRLLDIGQCNDAYSAIQIALALSKAFGVGVNELPLSMILSWYEQKAVAILLSLLYLGIRNIKLGPTLPAFVTPAVLKVLVDKFNIAPTTTAEEDLKEILG